MKSWSQRLLLWNLACALTGLATATQAQETPPAPETVFGPASSDGAAVPAKTSGLPDLGLVGWAIPQVRWSGNTGSTYVFNTDFLGSSALSQTQLVSGRASSFIYAPWFAQVTANAGLNTSGSSSDSVGAANKTTSTGMNYGGTINVFPMSHFPFSAYLDLGNNSAKANSSAAVSAATAESKSSRMGARQYYRPETGKESYHASVDRSSVTSGGMSSLVNAFQGGYSTTIDDHSLSGNTRFSSTSGDAGGQGSSLFSASGSHTWNIPDEGLSISNSAIFSRNDIKALATTGSGLLLNNSQLLQASSSLSWVPDEDLPLTISGGGGFLNATTSTQTADTSLVNLHAYANAAYRISNNWMLSGGATIASTSNTSAGSGLSVNTPSGDETSSRLLLSLQNASLSYTGDPLTFGTVSYNWGAGTDVSNQLSSLGGNGRSIAGSGQHSVNTRVPLSEDSALIVHASQSVGLMANSTSSTSGGSNLNASSQNTNLGHSMGLIWQTNMGPVSLATLSLNATDTLSSGSASNHMRSFAGNGSFQTQFGTRSSLNASFTVSANQQLGEPLSYTSTTFDLGTATTIATTAPPTTWSGSGNLSYSHRSPFNIPNLMYSTNFAFSSNQTNLRVISGDPNALSWQITRLFNQQATYRIGRLAFQATASVVWTGDGKKNASLFGSISREIGDF